MRQKRTPQSSIFDQFASHQIGRELQAISKRLDAHPELIDWVYMDLPRWGQQETGCRGISAETALRCALLKQYRQLSYEELAFHLEDSASFRAFARLAVNVAPKKSALQGVISPIRARTWERINRVVLGAAAREKIERARTVRIDSTVCDTPIHAPSDSTLLFDSVRVMVGLLQAAEELGASGVRWHNHLRCAKRRMRAISSCRGAEKRQRLYRELLAVTSRSLGYLAGAEQALQRQRFQAVRIVTWWVELNHYRPLIERVIEQTERRVLAAEKVPAEDKVVSLFEPHSDIIVKARRQTQYGHKLNLSSGRSGLILDVVVERGNPADSERFIPMLQRQREIYGRVPRQVAADGGFASQDNLRQAKAMGINDVAFHKKRSLRIEQMVASRWVYRKLRNFRAGIEADISCLKRAYGLARCTWKGLAHFRRYVWSAVVAYNLVLLARRTEAIPPP